MTRRLAGAGLALLVTLGAAGCGSDLLGPPKRPRTHGFRAHVTVRRGEKTVEEFELAVRGNARRKEKGTTVTLWDGDARTSFSLDTAAKTATPRPFTSLDEALPGHPLDGGFSEKEEAGRRHIEAYHREADGILGGHVCWIWRFEDRPDDPTSPSTSYWNAPDLDHVVLRVDEETPGNPQATRTTELTNFRIGADPELFRVPARDKR